MNELEQLKETLRQVEERIKQLEEKENPKGITIEHVLQKHNYEYEYNSGMGIRKQPECWVKSCLCYKDVAEAEHEMCRLILKRVAQYLNGIYGDYDFDTESTDIFVFCFYLDVHMELINIDHTLPVMADGAIYFGTQKAIEEARRIMGEEMIKKALSEDYCRKKQSEK